MPTPAQPTNAPDEFDLFISYAHSDDVGDIVAGLRDQLEADFQLLLQRPIKIFRDRDNIRDFDDWKVRCYHKLHVSRFFIVLLSPAYLANGDGWPRKTAKIRGWRTCRIRPMAE